MLHRRKDAEPFVFQLIRAFFPGNEEHGANHLPTSPIVVWVLIVLAGAAALVYAYASGLFSTARIFFSPE